MSKISDIILSAINAARLGRSVARDKFIGTAMGAFLGAGFAMFGSDVFLDDDEGGEAPTSEPTLEPLTELLDFASPLALLIGVTIHAAREVHFAGNSNDCDIKEEIDEFQELFERQFADVLYAKSFGSTECQSMGALVGKKLSTAIANAIASPEGIPTAIHAAFERELPGLAARVGEKLMSKNPEWLPQFQRLRMVWRDEHRPRLHCETLDHIVNGMHWHA